MFNTVKRGAGGLPRKHPLQEIASTTNVSPKSMDWNSVVKRAFNYTQKENVVSRSAQIEAIVTDGGDFEEDEGVAASIDQLVSKEEARSGPATTLREAIVEHLYEVLRRTANGEDTCSLPVTLSPVMVRPSGNFRFVEDVPQALYDNLKYGCPFEHILISPDLKNSSKLVKICTVIYLSCPRREALDEVRPTRCRKSCDPEHVTRRALSTYFFCDGCSKHKDRYRQRLYLDRTHKLHRGNRSIERVYRRLYDRVAWEERHFDKNRKAIGHDFFRNPEQGFADAESFRKFPYPFEPRQYPIIGSFPEEDMIEEARDRLEHAEIDAAKDLQVSPSKMKRIKAAGTILRYMEKQKNMGGSRHPRK